MFAVVNIAGQQFIVRENQKYYVPRLHVEPNSEIIFDEVLMVNNDGETKIGTPTLKDVKVHAKVLEHLKDDKIIVFKKKRRISYKRKRGHRQQLTRIEITKIA
ncbi:50S ribosomal protein L21 [Rosettibacter firmus]|uniref:50S ribosomal protein L21 n=1 Tax=Rosettibacter firmus TaxID=3111522 RepID=UPI00336BD3BD